ncbi:DUF4012 domain-containing protein [Micromonospora halophytica]|uniref:DUF4012 domain-containing protein n=1 Tax=Micromonospora halophytica TaxID=47864 RepID=A0A1C5HF21_9ACTN|nr:DUF4012 domain-containing protein [Micromonospora halophytica]SCG44618.1 Protein of unknown function [Micromonospora halophytica]
MVGSLLLAGAGWVGFRGWQARTSLLNAASLARELSAQIVAGDAARAQRTLAALQEQSGSARSTTGGPAWWLAGNMPYTGDDLTAVRRIAVAVDDLARKAFPPLVQTDVSALVPKEGRLDLGALRSVAQRLTRVDAAVRDSSASLRTVPTGGLLPEVQDALDGLRVEIDRLAGLLSGMSKGAQLLPALLGVDGARTYLLVSQNLSELRATGGMFGAYAVVRARAGRLELVKQGTAVDLKSFTPPLALDAETRGLYADLPGRYPADVNLTPHFPTAAKLYREMVRQRAGVTADGVLAVDPVALSYLLAAVGPVAVPGYPALSAETVVRTLLADSYLTMDLDEQDDFYAASAAAVFNSLLGRDVNPRGVLSAFNRSITERRILFWSARPEEQRTLAENRLSGILPEKEKAPTVGVFLNDGSGAKLGYYLRPSATLTVGDCQDEGRRELRLRFTLHSSAPAAGLTKAVLGMGKSGDPYSARTLVTVYSPAGGAVVGARLDGVETQLGSGTDRRRQVAIANVEVRPGATRTLDVDLLTGRATGGTPELWLTPTATPWTTQVVPATSCNQ